MLVLLAINPIPFAHALAGRTRGPDILNDLEVDVVRICYLLGELKLARVDRAGRLLLEIKFDGLALHDRGAEHIRQLLLTLAQLQVGATLKQLP